MPLGARLGVLVATGAGLLLGVVATLRRSGWGLAIIATVLNVAAGGGCDGADGVGAAV